jgi:glycosyltransferase involved in cell wall biosynthesis
LSSALVSVVIPVYNCERYVDEALRSVFIQEYDQMEVIVIDDGSTDRSADIIHSYQGARCIYQTNQGVSAARNAGIASSRGEFIAFLDADDVWMQDKLKIQMAFHLRHPEIGCSVGRCDTFLEPGSIMPSWLKERLLHEDEVGYFPSTLIARRDVFERVGVYDTNYRTGESADWFSRVKDAGIRIEILPYILLRKRVHEANLSHDVADTRTNMMKILRESINRKRTPAANCADSEFPVKRQWAD